MCSTVSKAQWSAFQRKVRKLPHVLFGETPEECIRDAHSIFGKHLSYDSGVFADALRERGLVPQPSAAGGFKLSLCE